MKSIENLKVPMKGLYVVGLISLMALAVGFWSLNSLTHQQNQLTQANNGSGVCFHRITQSFTALMIKDHQSQFLDKNFRGLTSECFDDLKSLVQQTSLGKGMVKTINKLQSDYHWFDQKVDRLLDIKGEVDISQSNITTKYTELEELKDGFDSAILASSGNISKLKTMSLAATGLGFLAFLLVAGIVILKNRYVRKEVLLLEQQAEENADWEIIGERYFEALDTPKVGALLLGKLRDLSEENLKLEESLLKMNTIGEQERYEIEMPEINAPRATAEFHNCINNVFDQLHSKAFERGILINMNLDEEFTVYSNQVPLEQMLLSLLTFSMDQSKKIDVRSKALGGIAYCKVIMDDFQFSDEEVNFMNGNGEIAGMNLNLVLLRELMVDADAKIALRNKKNSHENTARGEIEIILDRVNVQKSNIKVVKGNKKQIREFLDQQI